MSQQARTLRDELLGSGKSIFEVCQYVYGHVKDYDCNPELYLKNLRVLQITIESWHQEPSKNAYEDCVLNLLRQAEAWFIVCNRERLVHFERGGVIGRGIVGVRIYSGNSFSTRMACTVLIGEEAWDLNAGAGAVSLGKRIS